MNEPTPDARELVLQIFRELVGGRADRLRGNVYNAHSVDTAKAALCEDFKEPIANEIAFHLTDWNAEAAFIVALHLFPERFTPAEIRDGVESFLIHAPDHVAAAAKLAGYPIQDTFAVDALSNSRQPPAA
jgi:hypothetical protein